MNSIPEILKLIPEENRMKALEILGCKCRCNWHHHCNCKPDRCSYPAICDIPGVCEHPDAPDDIGLYRSHGILKYNRIYFHPAVKRYAPGDGHVHFDVCFNDSDACCPRGATFIGCADFHRRESGWDISMSHTNGARSKALMESPYYKDVHLREEMAFHTLKTIAAPYFKDAPRVNVALNPRPVQ